VQLTSDGRQRDVHDRAVEADDEQAQAADGQDEQSAPAAEFGQGRSPRAGIRTFVFVQRLLVYN
jgi:hypothetical protein